MTLFEILNSWRATAWAVSIVLFAPWSVGAYLDDEWQDEFDD